MRIEEKIADQSVSLKEYISLSKYSNKLELDFIKLKKENKLLNQIIEVMVDFYLRKKIKKNKKSPTFNFNFFN